MMIHRFQTLPSTNDEAMRLARAGAPAGTCVVAEEQTAGRGRAGPRSYAGGRSGGWMWRCWVRCLVGADPAALDWLSDG